MPLLAAAPGPSPAPCSIPMAAQGRGARVGARTSVGRGGLQNVALCSFPALASARACTEEKRNRVRKVKAWLAPQEVGSCNAQ